MDFPLPPVGEGLIDVELVRWLVRPGDAVIRGQALAELMSDKATMELPSPFAGTIVSLGATPGAKIRVGDIVLTYTPSGEANGAVASAAPTTVERPVDHPPEAVATTAVTASPKLPPAAPSVRLLARKFGIDLATIHGTGPHGRILLDDLTPHLTPRNNGAPRPTPVAGSDEPKLDLGIAGTTIPLIGLRRKIAEHMVESKRHIPHYSYIDECDVTELVRLRAQLRGPLTQGGVKLTYLAFIVKAVARALKEVPIVNSTLDEATGQIRLHDRYHIGVAVATPGGLMVPVVKDADEKHLIAVATELERLSNDAKAGRSRIDDLKGGTFTVTSIGNIGGLISTPIVNHPEVGILGMGKIVKRPVFDDAGRVKPADLVYLSFSFDHRIVDGAIGSVFGNAIIRQLQAPARLLLPETFRD